MNITISQLINCIKYTTETITVKVDDDDYYASRGSLTNAYIEVVNPGRLVELLEELEDSVPIKN